MKKLKNSPEVRKLHREAIQWHNKKFDKLTGIKTVNGKLTLFTPEADITYKMKKIVSAIKKAVIHLNILGLLFLFSCGTEDNPITGNPPVVNNDSLVSSLDSLALYGSGTKDTALTNVFASGDSIKVSFTVETDCSTNDTAFVSIFVGNISVTLDKSQIPNSFIYYGSQPPLTTGITFNLYLDADLPRYLKMKNIKIYKVL